MTLIASPAETTYYEIEARTLREVSEFLNKRLTEGDGERKEREDGRCTWRAKYEYDDVRRDGLALGLRVYLEVTIELPRWVGRDSAGKAEQREWDRYFAALRAHEQGHAAIARGGAKRTHDRMERAPTRKLKAIEIEEIGKWSGDGTLLVPGKIHSKSDGYDKRTKHGRKPPPGTMITIPADSR
jgi:predicted secreted Zn-dependent protease